MNNQRKGKFITIEGAERVGKSTYARMLNDYLVSQERFDFFFTREPGGTEIAERIREIILDKKYLGIISRHTEALLYAAARAQHIDEKILPALKEGKTVFCDRYIHSSYAYQGYARELGIDYVNKINAYALEYCMPDAVIFIDLPPEKAYKRTGGGDRLENEIPEFHKAVYKGFKDMAGKAENFYCIEPGKKEETFSKILDVLKKIKIID